MSVVKEVSYEEPSKIKSKFISSEGKLILLIAQDRTWEFQANSVPEAVQWSRNLRSAVSLAVNVSTSSVASAAVELDDDDATDER